MNKLLLTGALVVFGITGCASTVTEDGGSAATQKMYTEAEKDPELARKLLVHKIPRKVSFHVVLPDADKTDIFDWAECMFLSIYLLKF